MAERLSHVDAQGRANMVDVSDKEVTHREARAEGFIRMQATTLTAIRDHTVAKGDVLATARIAGIQAAKRCADLIPLCHPLALNKVGVDLALTNDGVRITTLARVNGKTGVEMEALTAASVAALTLYDMCKAMDRGMQVEHIRLLEKSGGRSGHWQRK